MPQMMPIKWLSLYMIFSITLILFSLLNYYNMIMKFPNSNINNNMKMIKNTLNWQW